MIDALFGSKTRVKLLYLFLNNPGKSFYVREITRKIDEQINSVRRELSNMLEVGVVKSTTIENKLFYEVNPKYLFYGPLRQIFTSTKVFDNDLSTVTSEWEKRFRTTGDTRIVIFAGKLVSGSISDVDLLVAGDVSKARLAHLVRGIEKEKGISISYTALTYEDFYYRLSVRDHFIGQVLGSKHAVIIDTEDILATSKEGV